jgi:hypothetical protein
MAPAGSGAPGGGFASRGTWRRCSPPPVSSSRVCRPAAGRCPRHLGAHPRLRGGRRARARAAQRGQADRRDWECVVVVMTEPGTGPATWCGPSRGAIHGSDW